MKSNSANRLQGPPEFPRSGRRAHSPRRSERLREAIARPTAIDEVEERLARDLPPTDRQLAGRSSSRHNRLRHVLRNTVAIGLGVVAIGGTFEAISYGLSAQHNVDGAQVLADKAAAAHFGNEMNADHLTLSGQPDPLPPTPTSGDTPPADSHSQ